MFQDSVPAGSYNDPFLSSVCVLYVNVHNMHVWMSVPELLLHTVVLVCARSRSLSLFRSCIFWVCQTSQFPQFLTYANSVAGLVVLGLQIPLRDRGAFAGACLHAQVSARSRCPRMIVKTCWKYYKLPCNIMYSDVQAASSAISDGAHILRSYLITESMKMNVIFMKL